MIRSLTILFYGVVLAAFIIAAALLASVWVLGMAVKASLFGEPRATFAVKLFERIMRERKSTLTDITHIPSDNGEEH